MMKPEIKRLALTDRRIVFSSCFELTFITCNIKDFFASMFVVSFGRSHATYHIFQFFFFYLQSVEDVGK